MLRLNNRSTSKPTISTATRTFSFAKNLDALQLDNVPLLETNRYWPALDYVCLSVRPSVCLYKLIICRHFRCDPGFGGITCRPESKLPSTLKTDFSLISQLHEDWLYVVGGELAGANQGCGTMLSGESLYFFQVSVYTEIHVAQCTRRLAYLFETKLGVLSVLKYRPVFFLSERCLSFYFA